MLAFETAFLALAFVVPASGGELAPAIAPLAIAMGAQNAVMRHAAGVSASLMYITGNLFKLGQSVDAALLRQSGRWTWSIYAAMWLGLMSGAIGGAIISVRIGFALAMPAAALALLSAAEAALLFRPKRL